MLNVDAMPIRLHIDQESRLTKFIASGTISIKDITTALESLFSGELTQNIVWDFRHSDPGEIFLPRKIKEIINFAKEDMRSRKKGKTAIVASSGIGYGLAKMHEAFAEIGNVPYPVRSFDSIDEALSWINSKDCHD